MTDITQILGEVESGKPGAADELLKLVYDELRALATVKMVSERLDHTLQGTALVHEAFLRLFQSPQPQGWSSRRHFFAAAAEAMRRVLIDHARSRAAAKRSGNRRRIDVADGLAEMTGDLDLLLDLDEGLSRLSAEDPTAAELVKLRLFAGLSVAEAGEMLGMSRTVAYRNWDFVRSWFAVHSGLAGD